MKSVLIRLAAGAVKGSSRPLYPYIWRNYDAETVERLRVDAIFGLFNRVVNSFKRAAEARTKWFAIDGSTSGCSSALSVLLRLRHRGITNMCAPEIGEAPARQGSDSLSG